MRKREDLALSGSSLLEEENQDFEKITEGHLVLVGCGHRGKPNRLEEKRISRLLRKSGFIPMLEELQAESKQAVKYKEKIVQDNNNNSIAQTQGKTVKSVFQDNNMESKRRLKELNGMSKSIQSMRQLSLMKTKRESLTQIQPKKSVEEEDLPDGIEHEGNGENQVEIEEVFEEYVPHNLDSPDEDEDLYKNQYDAGFEVFDIKDTAFANLPIE
mmetsp:Transcript_19280/g.18423  ORF Transcript_19280/g.18423 Transcript_19280/m.18423 type:complete len:214 (+) Transcript_19280:1879-2520(+)